MIRRIILSTLAVALCLALSGCIQVVLPGSSYAPMPAGTTQAPEPVETAPPSLPKPTLSAFQLEAMDYFDKIAFSSGLSDPIWATIVKRWEKPVIIQVLGATTDADLDTLMDLVAELTDLAPHHLELAFYQEGDSTQPNLFIKFVPYSQLAESVRGYKEGGWAGNSISWDDNGKITDGTVAIATDTATQAQRNHLIVMEVTQCLGFLGNSRDYPDSIYYSDWTDVEALSLHDRYLVSMLYSDVLYAGQPREKAMAALEEWLPANPPLQ